MNKLNNKLVNSLCPEKTCTVCGETKPTTRENFGTYASGMPRARCRVCTRKLNNEYAANNLELGRARARVRKERLENVGPVNEHLVYQHLLFCDQDGKCYYCKNKISFGTMEIDHLLPISRGGNNDFKNLVACCRSCNRAKGNRTESEFTEWGERLKNYKRRR